MARLALLKCRLRHSAGSDWPGDVALSYCPDILTRLSHGVDCILVTGTNGKTTTAAMIRKIFSSKSIPVITNLSEYQENRTGSPEELFQLLLSCVRKSDAVLCINEDCPVSGRMLIKGLPNRI
ncbi:MAG: hypothetical protein KBS39_00190, partial [Lachnospiraceae bacterium]|nr:hypothetical protein [Candidatus Hippenecus merdae]